MGHSLLIGNGGVQAVDSNCMRQLTSATGGDTVISYGGKCNQAGSKLDNSLPFYTLHTHPRLLAGMNSKLAGILREIVETERKYVKDLELVQVRSATQPHDRRSCHCGVFVNLFTPVEEFPACSHRTRHD